jgi:hypothetical protein
VEAQRELGVAARVSRRGDRLARGIFDQRVAALERALGLVGGEGEREALEVARVPDLFGARRGAGLGPEGKDGG